MSEPVSPTLPIASPPASTSPTATRDLVEMTRHAEVAVAVVEDHHAAVAAEPAGEAHLAGRHGVHRLAARRPRSRRPCGRSRCGTPRRARGRSRAARGPSTGGARRPALRSRRASRPAAAPAGVRGAGLRAWPRARAPPPRARSAAARSRARSRRTSWSRTRRARALAPPPAGAPRQQRGLRLAAVHRRARSAAMRATASSLRSSVKRASSFWSWSSSSWSAWMRASGSRRLPAENTTATGPSSPAL